MPSLATPRVAVAAVLATVMGLAASAADTLEASRPLLRMHDEFVLAFVDSVGFGYTRLPAMSRVIHKPVEGTGMFVAHLELIGVAKHDPPRVFSNEMSIFHRPDEKTPQPRHAARAMTKEERAALRELDNGKRLVVRPEGKGLRVIGAIRAADECLGCHKRQRAGDMLGAFVYSLQPMAVEPAGKK